MGLGAVLTGPDGTEQHQISEATTFTGCNNEAELRALMLALQWLAQQGIASSTPVQVFSDNSVLVEQLAATPRHRLTGWRRCLTKHARHCGSSRKPTSSGFPATATVQPIRGPRCPGTGTQGRHAARPDHQKARRR